MEQNRSKNTGRDGRVVVRDVKPEYVPRSSTINSLTSPIPRARLFGTWIAGLLFLLSSNFVNAVTTVGSTVGEFAVDSNGAATYTIPIVVVPGTNGMKPNLALVYNSQGGDGLVGTGWSIGGLSVIHRCGATLEVDGVKGGVNYDSYDRYCLDGERLINVGGNEYRTQHESWQKIIASGTAGNGPRSFTIQTNDGTVSEYGVTDDSRIEAQGKSDVRIWALNKVKDVNGNYLTITYVENNANGEYYPTRIDYTVNEQAGLVTPYNNVEFVYEDLPTIETEGQEPDYVGGSLVKNTKRLTNIKAYGNGLLARDYQLTYDNDGFGKSSRVTSVTECGVDDFCLPPTTFSWQKAQGSYQFKNTGTAWLSGIDPTSDARLGDINGDGFDDLVYGYNGIAYVHLSNGSSFTPAQNWGAGASNGNNEDYRGVSLVGDVNGDCLADYVYNVNEQIYVRLSTGSGFAGPVQWADTGYGIGTSNLADINGDGLADLIYVFNGSTFVHLSTGSGFSGAINWGFGVNQDTLEYREINLVGDVNGDGKADYVYGDQGVLYVRLSTGAIFSAPPPYNEGTNVGHLVAAPNLADVNGDGRDDFIDGYSVYLSDGKAFKSNAFWGGGFGPSGPAVEYKQIDISGDINGDGKQDYVWGSEADIYVKLSSEPTPDVITLITGGLDATISINYKPLTDSSVYTPGTGSVCPYRDVVNNSTFVVASYDASDGIGGTTTTTHLYGELKHHVRAATSLGFRWLKVTDPSGVVTTTNHKQILDGNEGVPEASYSVINGVTVKETSNTWLSVDLGDKRTLALNTYSQEITREVNSGQEVTRVSTATDEYSTDGYYLPKRNIVDFNDGYVKVTINEYYPSDEANWRFGQLYNTIVTATAPGQAQKKRTSSWTYNLEGRIETEVIEPTQSELKLTTTYGYDPFGNRTSTTVTGLDGADVLTRTTQEIYDSEKGQFVERKINALGHEETFAYNKRKGVLKSAKDPNDLEVLWDYDGLARKIKEYRPDESWTSWDYEEQTGQSWVYCIRGVTGHAIDSRLSESKECLDTLNRKIHSETQGFGGRWIFQKTVYDGLGRVKEVSHPYYADESGDIHFVKTEYDVLGRVTAVTEPGIGADGRVRRSTSVYNGLTTTVTNPLGRQKITKKNSQGKTIEVTDAAYTGAQAITTYTYDPFGNLILVVDAVGNQTSMQYDDRGRKTAMNDPDMGSWSYVYDALSQLKSQTDAKGQIINMGYDDLGRMTSRSWQEDDTTKISTWVYDASPRGSEFWKGKLTRVQNADATEYHGYDPLGRVNAVIHQIGGLLYNVDTSYDAFSRPEVITYPSTGFRVLNRYDDFGHLYQVDKITDSSTSLIWQVKDDPINSIIGVDAHGRVINEYFVNGVTTTHDYDHHTGDLSGIKTWKDLSVLYQDMAYQFDAVGNLLRRSDQRQGLTEDFGYDAQNRLVASSGPVSKTYRYDAIGNLTYKSDVGHYAYGLPDGSKPHAVAYITGDTNSAAPVFDDVPAGHWARAHIETLYYAGIANRCGATLYCPDDPLTRGQMARFLLKTKYGAAYEPPSATGAVFYDVPSTLPLAAWIEQLAAEGITSGCGNGNYCPDSAVTRAQMAVFLLKTKHGSSYQPPPATGVFGDVPASHWGAAWIEQLAAEGIPSGCGGGNYCPGASMTRATTAVFLVNAFGLSSSVTTSTHFGDYTYDANGNMISGAGRTIGYTVFNKPAQITGANGSVNFTYDANYKRIIKSGPNGSTVYIGGLYEKHDKNGITEHIHYVYAGKNLVAIHTEGGNEGTKTRYVHTDQLNSIDTITDESGNVVERLSFDPHGKRRPPNWLDATGPIEPMSTDHGFTGHEHDDSVGLVNMHARLYDPVLGRFLTPDSIIPGVTNSQALNRYSYVLNNPLSLVDPSGHIHKKISGGLKRLTKNIKRVFNSPYTRMIAAAVAAFHGQQWASKYFLTSKVAIGAVGGAIGGAVGAGNLKGAFSGGLTGAAFSWVGGKDLSEWKQVGAHALTGGATNAIRGGSFRDGFLSGGFSAWTSPYLKKIPDVLGRVLAAGGIGGAAAALGGGDFKSGFYTGAFARLFNHELHTNTYTAGIGFSGVAVRGIEGSAGLLITEGEFDIGLFFSSGEGPGFNFSTDTFIGALENGTVFNLIGPSENTNMVLGGLSVSIIDVPSLPGEANMFTAGAGPGIPIGFSTTDSYTHAISYRTLVRWTTDKMCSILGGC